MRRTIDGITYDTELATRIAFASWQDRGTTGTPESRYEYALYQSGAGELFLHIHTQFLPQDAASNGLPVSMHDFLPLANGPDPTSGQDVVSILAELFGNPADTYRRLTTRLS